MSHRHHPHTKQGTLGQVQGVWCSGPMMTIFDAASDGDAQAIELAMRVCASCPMLDACRRDRDEPGRRPVVGVQAGAYYPPPLVRSPQSARQPVAA